jgi:hypothetical protein
MTTSTLARLAAATLLLSACGGDDDGASDAGAGTDGAPRIDADTTDASIVDCAADYRERGDAHNNPVAEGGSAEVTGLAVTSSSAPFTMCGQIDPAHASAVVADADAYAFELGANAATVVRIEMVAPDGADLDGLALRLYEAGEGPPVERAKGVFRNGYALIAGVTLQPGLYWVGVSAGLPAPDAPVGYTLTVSRDALACAAASGDPDHLETADGAGRGNDVVAITYEDPPALTASGIDAPESTGETLEPDQKVHLRGTSAALGSDGDSYLDRDTFLVATGTGTTELELRLRWPDGDVDLDLYLFSAGDLVQFNPTIPAVVAGESKDEVFTVNVVPDESYWVWVGAYDNTGQDGGTDLPVTYDVTLCPRAH